MKKLPNGTYIVTMDAYGRITIPKEFRDRLKIRPGDELLIWTEDDCIYFKPKAAAM